jgi:hypothetical protein
MFVFLMVALLIVSACGSPAMMPATRAPTESGETFVVALPRVVLTADEGGAIGVEGLCDPAQRVSVPVPAQGF